MQTLLLLLALLVPGSVLAEGVLTPAANPIDNVLYDYRTEIRLQDEFIGGTSSTGGIGENGWLFTNGTTSQIAPEAGIYGIIRRDTSAASGTVATLQLNGAIRAFLGSASYAMTWRTRLNTNDANTQVRIGIQSVTSGNPDTNGVYLEKLDGDTNWFCVTRASSSQTRVDSGVAVGTSFFKTEIAKSAAGVQFAINGAQVCGLMTATIPTAAMIPLVQIVNSAASSKTIDTEFFRLVITGLSR